MQGPITWEVIVAMVGIVGGVVGAILAIRSAHRTASKDETEEAKGIADMRNDVKYISRGVDDIRVEQRAQREQMSELTQRVTRVEESSKQAHKRLDGIAGGRVHDD